MAAIKSIKVGETVYDLKATYDGSGNVIDQTYAKSSAIPTKVSQLQNDENYLKEHQDISGLATKTELESKVDKELGKGLSEANYTETENRNLVVLQIMQIIMYTQLLLEINTYLLEEHLDRF